MPRNTIDIDTLMKAGFDLVPANLRTRIYGVDYVKLTQLDGSVLYVTRHGWPHVEHLLPGQWFDDEQYAHSGNKLPGGTGSVYRVPTRDSRGRRLYLVVKFSRLGQDVPLFIDSFPVGIPQSVVDEARFNDPFEEFAFLDRLRRGHYGPPELHILTKRAMGIYSPAKEYEEWELGRQKWRFSALQRHFRIDAQAEQEQLDIHRQYITLFHWIKGINAEDLYDRGLLTLKELEGLTVRVTEELARKGFRVLDNKPRHFILRLRDNGKILRRGGKIVYGLVDFELLQPTEEYQQAMHERRAAGLDSGASGGTAR